MKLTKIVLLGCLLTINFGARPHTIPIYKNDTIKPQTTEKAVDTSSSSNTNKTDYKRATDSLLNIAQKTNEQAAKNLLAIKTVNNKNEKMQAELCKERQKFEKNFQTLLNELKNKKVTRSYTITKNSKKPKVKADTVTYIDFNGEVVKLDSVYIRTKFLKKKEWVYRLTFPDGSKKLLK